MRRDGPEVEDGTVAAKRSLEIAAVAGCKGSDLDESDCGPRSGGTAEGVVELWAASEADAGEAGAAEAVVDSGDELEAEFGGSGRALRFAERKVSYQKQNAERATY